MSKNKKKKISGKRGGFLLKRVVQQGDVWAKASILIMGIANLRRKQIIKGLLFLASEVAFIAYMIFYGASSLKNMMTLGTQTQGWVFDETLGIDVLTEGDNSMLLLSLIHISEPTRH